MNHVLATRPVAFVAICLLTLCQERDASAQVPNFYDVVAVKNETGQPVRVQNGFHSYDWGADITIQPGETKVFAREYNPPTRIRARGFCSGSTKGSATTSTTTTSVAVHNPAAK